ncbi:MAG: dienelactone hydrolase family protein [Armatimonadetes bacterium]|nr:dienelactone hydrolase family protein [Armatimonadota bacterium]
MLTTVLLLATLQNPPQAACCDFASFAKDPLFATMHPLKEPTGWQPTDGVMVSYSATDGSKASGFWVKPSGEDKACIIMVHEWWGLNDHIKETAEKLSAETGYGVLAIDLYRGKVATDGGEANQYMNGVKEDQAQAVVAGAVKAVKHGELYEASAVGTVGYCFGGGWSHKTAIAGGEDVDACVVYYGMPDTRASSLKRLQAPVLMIWPTKDAWINASVVASFKSAMKAAGKQLTVESYDADHAFANPSSARYNEEAASDAWRKTIAFYKEHLGGG